MNASGFRQSDSFRSSNLVVGGVIWKEGKPILPFETRANHFASTFSLGSKSGYHQLMREFASRTGQVPSFYPETYYLPPETKQLENAFPTSKYWIQKPAGGSRGKGITLINDFNEATGKVVVQKYIDRPILINGFKFDLRFYVAVPSLDPLRVYLYDNGLVRLATSKYETNFENPEVLSAHLTNFSINKESEEFQVTEDVENDGKGSKWSHKPFWPFLKTNGFDAEKIKIDIEDAIATVIIAARQSFLQQTTHRSSFEMFGFDVLISETGSISILEINVSPALGTSSNLDMFIKAPLTKDFFNLALVPIQNPHTGKIEQLAREDSGIEAELIFIIEYEKAKKACGGFNCIYPTKKRIQTHTPLLETVTPFDEALNKWVYMSEEEKSFLLN